ncbi:helix-turn-helix domain-containing protein [Nocardiopsis dassonvillei]|uniref:helix-turn-helix domain-containing protein n=1 Tax=Nocardiopsis dassonvillei TaxID=2014 RepID=UPI0018DB8C62
MYPRFLTLTDRERIADLHHQGQSLRAIGRQPGRPASTIKQTLGAATTAEKQSRNHDKPETQSECRARHCGHTRRAIWRTGRSGARRSWSGCCGPICARSSDSPVCCAVSSDRSGWFRALFRQAPHQRSVKSKYNPLRRRVHFSLFPYKISVGNPLPFLRQ